MARSWATRQVMGFGRKATRELTRPLTGAFWRLFRVLALLLGLAASYWVIGWAPVIGAVLALILGAAVATILASVGGVVFNRHSLKSHARGKTGAVSLALMVFGLGIVAVDYFGYTLGPRASLVAGWSWELLARKTAWAAIVIPLLGNAIGYTHHSKKNSKVHSRFDLKLAAILRVPVAEVAKSSINLMKVDGAETLTVSPLPPGAAMYLGELDERLRKTDPAWEVDWERTGPDRLTLRAESARTAERRILLDESQGLIADISPEPAPTGEPADLPAGYSGSVEDHAKLERSVTRMFGPGHAITEIRGNQAYVAQGTAPVRPSARTVQLAQDLSSKEGQLVADFVFERYGLPMVHWDPARDVATVANLLAPTLELRDRLARSLSIEPWQLEIAPSYADGQLSALTVMRSDARVTGDHDKRVGFWLDKARTVVGHAGWYVEVDNRSGHVRMIGGVLPELPALVPLDDMVCDYDPSKWDFIPHGLTPEGGESGSSLKAGPHTVVVGATGAGKSYTLLSHTVQALARGHRWVMIDPTKNAVDFAPLKPWASVFYDDDNIVGAGQVLEKVYAERVRRQQILRAHGVGNWAELSKDVREREDVVPMTVVIDEAASLLETDKAIAGLDEALKEEMEAELAAKGLMKLRLKKLGREARNVGIFLILGLQRPDVEFLPGEFRQNLGTKVQLQAPGMPLPVESLRMIFPGEMATLATEMFRLLDDGRPGLAVTAIDGGKVTGVRPAYVHNSKMPGILESRGVPKAKPWGGSADPIVIDLGEMELDLEDFKWDVDDGKDASELDLALVSELAVTEHIADADEDPFAAPLTEKKPSVSPLPDEDPFGAVSKGVSTAKRSSVDLDDDDPFA